MNLLRSISMLIFLASLLLSCQDYPDGAPLGQTAQRVKWVTDMTVSQRSIEARVGFAYDAVGNANAVDVTTTNEPELITAIYGRNGYVYTVRYNIYIWTADKLETYVYYNDRWEVEYRDGQPARVAHLDNRTEDTLSVYEIQFLGNNIRSLEVYDSDGEFKEGYFWDSYDDKENVFKGSWWIWHAEDIIEVNDVYTDLFPVAFFMENNPRSFRKVVNGLPDEGYELSIFYSYDDEGKALTQNFNESSIPTIHQFEYKLDTQ